MVGSDQNRRQVEPDDRQDRPLPAEAERQDADGRTDEADAGADFSDLPGRDFAAGNGPICQPADRNGEEQEEKVRQSWDQTILKRYKNEWHLIVTAIP